MSDITLIRVRFQIAPTYVLSHLLIRFFRKRSTSINVVNISLNYIFLWYEYILKSILFMCTKCLIQWYLETERVSKNLNRTNFRVIYTNVASSRSLIVLILGLEQIFPLNFIKLYLKMYFLRF